MDPSEAIWCAARQHVFLFSGFILLSAIIAIVLAVLGREEARWMALMLGVWVVINAAVAVWIFRHIHLPPVQILPHVFRHIRIYMWLNVAADLVYAFAGGFLLRRSGQHRLMLRGFGKAILLQAAGLLVLDMVFLARVIALHQQYLAG
jgi:hypothetical protein